LWAAGLGLTTGNGGPGTNRYPRHERSLYAGPQSFMGHRLVNRLTGINFSRDNVRIQRVDVTEIFVLLGGVLTGVNQQQSLSAETPAGPIVVGFPGDLAYLLTAACVATSGFRESPVTLGYFDPQGAYSPLTWGSQFLPRSSSDSDITKFPEIVVETLRRLKIIVAAEGSNGIVATYPVWSMSDPTQFFSPDSVYVTPVIPNFNLANFTDTASSAAIAINNTGLDLIGSFYNDWQAGVSLFQGFVKFSSATSEREQSSQMLTNLVRFVVPPVTSFISIGRSSSGGKHSNASRAIEYALERRAKQMVAVVPVVKGQYRRPRLIMVKPETAKAASTTVPYMQAAQGSHKPANPVANKFYVTVIPISYVNPNPSTPSLNAALLPALMRQGIYSFFQSQDILVNYVEQIFLTGLQTTRRADGDTVPNELLAFFHNRTNAGLGGALGSTVATAFGMAKNQSVKDFGVKVGDLADALAKHFQPGFDN